MKTNSTSDKAKFLVLILVTSGIFSSAQNLIQNSGFEYYTQCPEGQGEIACAAPWFNPAVGTMAGTPDYFNACSTVAGVPSNLAGNIPAHSGSAYVGIYTYSSGADVREYVVSRFSTLLEEGVLYHLEMYVSAADSFQFSSPEIGVYFSDDTIPTVNDWNPLPYAPQVSNDLSNTFNSGQWTLVQGDYLAHGGEEYILIGNFKNDAATTAELLNETAAAPSAYTFIDDVTLSIITGVEQTAQLEMVESLYPNPFQDKLQFNMAYNVPVRLSLYNASSMKVMEKNFSGKATLDTGDLEAGIYIYEITGTNGNVSRGKILKQ